MATVIIKFVDVEGSEEVSYQMESIPPVAENTTFKELTEAQKCGYATAFYINNVLFKEDEETEDTQPEGKETEDGDA